MRQFSCTVFDQPHRLGGGMFEGRGRGSSANDTEAGVVDMDDAGSDVKGNDIFVDEQKRAWSASTNLLSSPVSILLGSKAQSSDREPVEVLCSLLVEECRRDVIDCIPNLSDSLVLVFVWKMINLQFIVWENEVSMIFPHDGTSAFTSWQLAEHFALDTEKQILVRIHTTATSAAPSASAFFRSAASSDLKVTLSFPIHRFPWLVRPLRWSALQTPM
jgi:hypothetical protein